MLWRTEDRHSNSVRLAALSKLRRGWRVAASTVSSAAPLLEGAASPAFALVVVAALDRDDTARFPWATWYHEQAPQGKYQKAPAEYARLVISPIRAMPVIDLIKAGRPLPPDFVAALPVVY